MLGVREDGDDDLSGYPPRAGSRTVLGMLVERGVHLVVEVVEQRGDAPELSSPSKRAAYDAVDASTAAHGQSASLFGTG